MQLSQLSAFWQRLTAVQRISLTSLLFFLAILPAGIWLVLSPTSPFSRASTPVTAPSSPSPSPISLFAQAIKFSKQDNSYLTTAHVKDISSNEFTIEGWFKIPKSDASMAATGEGYSLINTNTESLNKFNLVARIDPYDRIGLTFTTGYGTSPINSVFTDSIKGLVTPEAWSHIAVTYQIKDKICTARIYVNGQLSGNHDRYSEACPTLRLGSLLSFIFGRPRDSDLNDPAAYAYYYPGEMDEVRVSNIVRYTSNFTPSRTPFAVDGNTVSLWHFDNNFQDAAGGVNEGQVSGNIEFVVSTVPVILPSPTPSPGPRTQNYSIGRGWNLIAVPVHRRDLRAEDVLKDLNTSFVLSGSTTGYQYPITHMFSYNVAAGRWLIHTLGSTTDDNFYIGSTNGYFVRSLAAGNSSISGQSIGVGGWTVSRGWSTLAIPEGFSDAEALLQAMKSQGIEVGVIVRWFGGRYVLHLIGSEANNFPIVPGEGYWIRNNGEEKTFYNPRYFP